MQMRSFESIQQTIMLAYAPISRSSTADKLEAGSVQTYKVIGIVRSVISYLT